MKEAFEKIIERLEGMFGCDPMYYGEEAKWAVDKAVEIVNEVAEEYKNRYVSLGTYQQCAWERDIAIKQLHDLGYELGQKIESNDVIVSNLAKAYAVNIKRYGVDVTEKWATATQNAAALNQAYLRGRQDERDKFDEWREECKDTNVSTNIIGELKQFLKEKKEYNSEQADIWRGNAYTNAHAREMKDLYMDRANTFGGVLSEIKALEEEYSNDGWILVSERLPEAGTHRDVWISIENEVAAYRAKWYLSHFEWENGWVIKEPILAWMPNDVPEVYQPKGE